MNVKHEIIYQDLEILNNIIYITANKNKYYFMKYLE